MKSMKAAKREFWHETAEDFLLPFIFDISYPCSL